MQVGINYPWIDYGWDFGDPPSAWIPAEGLAAWRETKRKRIEEDFRRFSEQGIFAVRWFLLGDGLNYGTDARAPRKEGGWIFDPLPSGHSFYSRLREDFEFALQACRNNNLKLFPSLIDFHWCRPGLVMAGNPGIIKGGRHDVIRDEKKRQVFLDRVLEPLLASSLEFRDSIYAWELINEPEWVVKQFSFFRAPVKGRTVSKKEMKAFISEGVRRIHSRRLPDGSRAFQSSVGFAHWASLNRWDAEELGLTLHQFHYYARHNRELPEHARLKLQPGILGEFATAEEEPWPDLKAMNREQSIVNRLSLIEEKGYSACFLWSANAKDKASRWTEDAHLELLAYGRTSNGNTSLSQA